MPWGSQVRASAVDTGSRGRRGEGPSGKGKKRKREAAEEVDNPVVLREADDRGDDDPEDEGAVVPQKAAVMASTGFVHLLPPTPEIWTASLPHRTQVVYTPDYSYILQRIQARPGSVLIEAGAGSGSFTHAAARAVFNGYPETTQPRLRKKWGKIWSYEFHEQRVQKLRAEIREHALDGIVQVTHKDVCQDGFSIDNSTAPSDVNATAIFLDLPAPWLALKHLTRTSTFIASQTPGPGPNNSPQQAGSDSSQVLDPTSSIHLCTFSPCIEQVQRTVATLRKAGWHDIETVELAAKRIETKRERVGLQEEGLRGVNASPASVDEAVSRLRELEGCARVFHNNENGNDINEPRAPNSTLGSVSCPAVTGPVSKQQRLENIQKALEGRKLYNEGRLVHRAEQELKMHTSYLVFAILPREWSVADELAAQEKWSGQVPGAAGAGAGMTKGFAAPVSKRQMKKAAKAKAGGNKAFELKIVEEDEDRELPTS